MDAAMRRVGFRRSPRERIRERDDQGGESCADMDVGHGGGYFGPTNAQNDEKAAQGRKAGPAQPPKLTHRDAFDRLIRSSIRICARSPRVASRVSGARMRSKPPQLVNEACLRLDAAP
jgi:hypothetical protein